MTWHQIRSSGMLAISIVACPCHLPLVLPIALTLLAGTPIAIWLTQSVNWVAGALTIIFLSSLVIGLRWMTTSQSSAMPPSSPTSSRAPVCPRPRAPSLWE